MAEHTQILLVEGKNDYQLLGNLLGKNNLPAQLYHEERPPHGISIKPMESKSQLASMLANFIPKGEVHTLGIVIDADHSLESSIQMVHTAVKKHARADWPPLPVAGLITTATRHGRPPLRLGLWIMPNNQQTGMLEHFASELISPTDQLWQHAQQTVANLPEKRFPTTPNNHTRKAELHTWLAWQKEPGKPMGIAVRSSYFKTDAPLAQAFVTWAQELFLPSPPITNNQ